MMPHQWRGITHMAYGKGDVLELDLHDFSSDGRAVGRTEESMTVFVRGGLPGQRVLAGITGVKKRMAEADMIRIVKPAPEERPSACPHADSCGGCPWQCLPYPLQLDWKRNIVQNALLRIGRLSVPKEALYSLRCVGEDAEWGYRNKMEFAFAASPGGELRLGLRARASRNVVEVTECRLQTPRTMQVLAALRELCGKYGLSAAPSVRTSRVPGGRKNAFSRSVRYNEILRFVVIREPRDGDCLVELITLPSPQEAQSIRRLGQDLLEGPWGVTGFVHSIRISSTPVAYGEETAFTMGKTVISETLCLQGRKVSFRLDHNSFFQVNSRAAELLYNSTAELAKALFPSTEGERWGRQCWDIYCGAGGLALTMAPHFTEVFGLETVAAAVALAEDNAIRARGAGNCNFETGDAASLERCFRQKGIPDLLVTDPPRSGMDSRTVQAILRHQPPRLVLVSCNPATLARDLSLLAPAYDIRGVLPVDLFPQTPHIETVVSLTRK